ncbi:MAG TPA: aspartate-semialdehyde dehydrogenase [bacterium]|nr:aspartate-semialdehyde dehydrogenase [bacterium]
MKKQKYNLAILGATGVVGREMIEILAERKFPVGELRLFASEKSVGEEIEWEGKPVKVRLVGDNAFAGIDIVMGDTPTAVSKELIPKAVAQGAVAVDCSSAFRMDPNVPLVVPEVNAAAIARHKGIIAGANCSAIPVAVAVKPIHDQYGVKRLVLSTYQSASGAGKGGTDELAQQTTALFSQKDPVLKVFPYRLAFNVIPQIDSFLPGGDTKEEAKIVEELKKMIEAPNMGVTVTAVRVPVFVGHSAAVNIETEKKAQASEVRELLRKIPGVVVKDEPAKKEYPLPIEAAGQDEVYVGRIREDASIPNGLNLWVAADNLRKGAALNAVQIAEILIEKYL